MAVYFDIPEAKPAFELIFGLLVQKMSPRRRHALVQGALLLALSGWARERGSLGTEWRFRIGDGANRNALVPDVAFVAFERLRALRTDEEREEPPFAPDIAIEVLSPADDRLMLARKIGAYLRGGAGMVLVADPVSRTIELHDRAGLRVFQGTEGVAHPAFPGLLIEPAEVFGALDRR